MWMFVSGVVCGALVMAYIFGESLGDMESDLELRKREYRYTYEDIRKAWRDGFEKRPPSPPSVNYDI